MVFRTGIDCKRHEVDAVAIFGNESRRFLFMFKEARPTKVLLYQSIGFLAIIALCMLDELIGLSSLLSAKDLYFPISVNRS